MRKERIGLKGWVIKDRQENRKGEEHKKEINIDEGESGVREEARQKERNGERYAEEREVEENELKGKHGEI